MANKTKTVELDANGKRKFGMLDKLAYAAGDFGCNMSFALKGTVQTFWLVYMYMETGLLSALLLVVQIWDAVNDPMIGALIDRDRGNYKHAFFKRLGKFKTYIFIGACGLLLGGAVVFLPLPEAIRVSQETVNVVLKSIVFILAYIIWDACYTVANVPYGSMLSLVSEDKIEQAQLSTWRSIGAMVGGMVPGIILPMIIWQDVKYDGTGIVPDVEGSFHTNPLKNNLPYEIGDNIINPETGSKFQILLGDRVFLAALIMGVLGFITFMFMIKSITIRADENSVRASEGNGEKFNVVKSFGTFFKNRPAIGATIAAMGMFLGMQSAGTANQIMFVTYFGMGEMSGVVQIIGYLPMILFIPFIKKLVSKYGKKEVAVVGTGVSLIGGVLMFIFPLINDPTISLIAYIAALVVFGLGLGAYTCISWAMISDAIDYSEWKTGKKESGTVYSIHSFFRKLAQGVGPSMVLLIMGWIGYVSKSGVTGQNAQVAHNMCWLVAGLYLFSAIMQFIGIAFIYNIDKKTLETMNADLEARKVAEISEEA